jgi:hypothetical protein
MIAGDPHSGPVNEPCQRRSSGSGSGVVGVSPFDFIIMESVLRNRFAPPGYMLAQVERIEFATTLPNVTIRIVTDRAELVYPPVTSFTLLDDEVVVTESMDAQASRDRRSVELYRNFFDAYIACSETELAPILQRYKVRYAELARTGES